MLTNDHRYLSGPIPLVDWLKAVGCQLILLHHFSRYGAVSEVLSPAAGSLGAWLEWEARLAVQVFLVIGGFLAMRTLAVKGLPAGVGDWLRLCRRRFVRLAVPLWTGLAMALVSAALARALSGHSTIPAAPDVLSLLAHLLMLQDILGMDALSAGIWYVAIDLQLFALLALLGLLPPAAALAAGSGLFMAALFWLNREAAFDPWGPYFFASYALGAGLWLFLAAQARRPALAAAAVVTALAAASAALWLDWRDSLVVALATTAVLAVALHGRVPVPSFRPVSWLSAVSYHVLLLHYPVFLLADALFDALGGGGAGAALVTVVLAWAGTLLLAEGLSRHIGQ